MGNETTFLPIETVLGFIPEGLRDKPFYQRIASLLHHVCTSPETANMDLVRQFYDTSRTKDISKLEALLNAEPVVKLFNLSKQERRTFLEYLKTIYALKGTTRGLQLVLAALGIQNPEVYEWFYVNEHLEDFGFCPDLVYIPTDPGPPNYNDVNLYYCNNVLPPCTFLLIMPQVNITNDFFAPSREVRNLAPRASSLDFDAVMQSFLELFIHACVTLEILWLKVGIREIHTPRSDFGIIDLIHLNNTVCTDRRPARLEHQMLEEFEIYRKLGRTTRYYAPSLLYEDYGGVNYNETTLLYNNPYLFYNVGYYPPWILRYNEGCLVYNGEVTYKYKYNDSNMIYAASGAGGILYNERDVCPGSEKYGPPDRGLKHDGSFLYADNECSPCPAYDVYGGNDCDCAYPTYDRLGATLTTRMLYGNQSDPLPLLRYLAETKAEQQVLEEAGVLFGFRYNSSQVTERRGYQCA